MAKSIEEKAVQAIADAMMDGRFREHEFSRVMAEQNPLVHKTFFRLIFAYLNYISVFDRYGWSPNDNLTEAAMASEMLEPFVQPLDTSNNGVLK